MPLELYCIWIKGWQLCFWHHLKCSITLCFTFSFHTLSPSVKMSGPKKKRYGQWVLSVRGGQKNAFSLMFDQWLYVWYVKKFAVFKEYNISHHFALKHANYANKQSTQEWAATAERLMANLQTRREISRQLQWKKKHVYICMKIWWDTGLDT